MNALFKQLRPLSLPFWLTLILAATLPLVRMLNNQALLGDLGGAWGFFTGLMQICLFGGILLLAVLPFGMEFQNHTLSLLLSQPRSRTRIWMERTGLAGGLIVICGLAHWVSHLAIMIPLSREVIELVAGRAFFQMPGPGFNLAVRLSDVSSMDLLGIFGFMLATACTAGFWTLGGRSIIGGVVFTFAGEVGATGLVYGIISRFTEDETIFILSLLITGTAYCALLMWLGWRNFVTMQLKAASIGESPELPLPARFSWRPRWLQSSATNRWLNLLLKELRLQKPILLLTVLFVAGWTVLALLSRAQSVRQGIYEILLAVIIVGYVSLTAILAGSVAVVDERTLGISEWHLTFPVKACSQWLVKLLASLVLMAVGVSVPCLMYYLIHPAFVTAGELSYAERFGTVLAIVSLVTITSFWAATMTDGVVRAAIMTVGTIALLSACVALGAWSADRFAGLQIPLVRFCVSWPLLSDEDLRHGFLERFAIAFPLVILALLFLRRSFVQFRRVRIAVVSTARWALLMLLLTCASGFWCADLIKSVQRVIAGY